MCEEFAMSRTPTSHERLTRENAELRIRLAEAEETLHAIRTGAVDALLVSGVDGDQVFTLKGADHAYRVLIEAMNEGALTVTMDGVILYANRRFAEMLKAPLEKIIGSSIYPWIASADHTRFAALVRHDDAATHRREELTLRASDGTFVPGYVSANLLPNELRGLCCLVVTDLTEQKRNEVLVADEQLARSILEQAADAMVVCDAQGQIIRASEAAHALCGQNPLGLPFARAFPLHQGADGAFSLAESMTTGSRSRVEVLLQHQKQVQNLLVSIGPLLDAHRERLGSVITLIDITQRRETEERLQAALHAQEVLLKETHHRVKNNLQVVVSLLRLQARQLSAPSAVAALRDSLQRVEVMALVHELLYRTGDMASIDAAAYIRQLSSQMLRLYDAAPGHLMVELAAEGIWLSLDQAVPCGLIIHELFSNSLKYAFPDGRPGTVGIALRATSPDTLTLTVWDTGVGLPTDAPAPAQPSLGTSLVRDLVRQLRGTIVITSDAGVAVTITFPQTLVAAPTVALKRGL
jgi:PAS domain S-box-containing protein